MLEVPKSWNICREELPTESGARLKEKYAEGRKARNSSRLSPRMLGMMLRDLEFALLGFCVALVQFFLALPSFLHSGMAMNILCATVR